MPDIPRTLAQHCAGIDSNTTMIAHIARLSEACDKFRDAIQRLEAENAALRQLLTTKGK